MRTMNRTISPTVETAASPTARAVRARRERMGERFSRGAFFFAFFPSGFFPVSGAGVPSSGTLFPSTAAGASPSGTAVSSGEGNGTVSPDTDGTGMVPPDTGGTGAVSSFGISL